MGISRINDTSKIFAVCIAFFLLVFQILPLFWNKQFFFDWVNHVWVVEYYSVYLKQHGSFPTTIDVAQGFGSPLPIFYGVFFYPLLAIISIITGADLAVRIFCGVLLLAPMISFFVVFRALAKGVPLAILLAVTVNSSVYQLTNLYARSALTEFVAYQLLILALSLIFYGVTRKSRIGTAALPFGVACATLSLGTHPITFYTFIIFVMPLLFLGYFSLRRVILPTQLIFTFIWALCAFFILLPWAINTFNYRGDLAISNIFPFVYFPNSIDSLWGKLGLFYVDQRVLTDGIAATSTPFLDAPFSLGLILIVVMVLIRLVLSDKMEFYKLVIPSLLCISLIIYIVIPPNGALAYDIYCLHENAFLYKLLKPIQFVYRLSGTFSLCLIVALLAGFSALCRTSVPERLSRSLIGFAYISALIALIAAGQKLYVTYAEFVQYPAYRENANSHSLSPKDADRVLLMKKNDYKEIIRNVNSYPVTFYGSRDYTMPCMYPSNTIGEIRGRKLVSFHATEYGKEAVIACDQPCVLLSNIVPSKFHRVLIDGIEPKDIKVSNDGNLEFLIDAGSHTFKIDIIGKTVKFVSASIWVMLLWFFGSFVLFLGQVMVRIT